MALSLKSHAEGQSFLALVILIGFIVIVVGAALAFLVTSSIGNIYGYQAATRAEAVATAGAQDALLQLNRNSLLSTNYSLTVGSDTAQVTVTQGSPSSGFTTILSAATVSNNTRKVKVVVSINATTSQTSVVSWADVQ